MFIPLTDDRGERIYVNMALVQCLMPYDAQDFHYQQRSCRSRLRYGEGVYDTVRETVEDIHALVERAAGHGPPVN